MTCHHPTDALDINMAEYKKPFEIDWVLRLTIEKMVEAIEFSLEKATERLPEFIEDPEKSKEVIMTISTLQKLKDHISDYEYTKFKNKGIEDV
jgi:hypothetical protein